MTAPVRCPIPSCRHDYDEAIPRCPMCGERNPLLAAGKPEDIARIEEKGRLRLEAARDAQWVWVRQHASDLARLGFEWEARESDVAIIKRACRILLGELTWLDIQRAKELRGALPEPAPGPAQGGSDPPQAPAEGRA